MDNIECKAKVKESDVLEVEENSTSSLIITNMLIIILTSIVMFILNLYRNNVSTIIFLSSAITIVAYTTIIIARRRFNTKKDFDINILLSKETTYKLDSKGITKYVDENNISFIEYENVYWVTQTKNIILIYVSTRNVFMIPKRFFEEKDLITFKEIIRKYVPEDRIYRRF